MNRHKRQMQDTIPVCLALCLSERTMPFECNLPLSFFFVHRPPRIPAFAPPCPPRSAPGDQCISDEIPEPWSQPLPLCLSLRLYHTTIYYITY